MVSTERKTLVETSTGRRVVGVIIDYAIALAVGGSVAYVLGLHIFDPLPSAALTLIFWLVKSVAEAQSGKTLGKLATGLKVVTDDGNGTLRIHTSAVRNSWILLEMLPVVGSIASTVAIITLLGSCLQGASSTGLHDQYTGAMVRL